MKDWRDHHPPAIGGTPTRVPVLFTRPPEHLIAKDPEDFTPEEQAEFHAFVTDVFNRMNAAREEIHGKD
jgi:hypothetical protein